MRPLKIVLVFAALLAMAPGCTRESDGPKATGADGSGSSDTLYLGKPLAHWIDEARAGRDGEALERTVAALTLALESPDLNVMVSAADAIETIGPGAAPAAAALASKLDHEQPWLRTASMDALTSIGAPAVPALIEAVENGPGGAPVRAAIVLGAIGPAAEAAIPALEKALSEAPAGGGGWFETARAQILGTSPPESGAERAEGGFVTDAVPAAALLPEGAEGGWPRFRGPAGDGLCRERGLRVDWSEEGPSLLWKVEGMGDGYSSVSISGGQLYTMGDRTPPGGARAQFVIACDPATGRELWATRVGAPHDDGPRSTPTLVGDLVYAIGTGGDLVCLEARGGAVRWRRSFTEDFGGSVMSRWKYSESPLVDGEKVVCTPGGPEAMVVALDRRTGETIWKCAVPALGGRGKDGAGYASAVIAEIDGVRQYVQLIGRGVVGVGAATGRFLWGYNAIANSVANIPTPVVRGSYVFATTSYGTGSALLKVARAGDTFEAKEVYRLGGAEFENHHGGVVLVGDHVYGGHGQNRGEPVCVHLPTGKIAWRGKAPARGSAAVLYADGRLLFRYDRGPIASIEATPEAFRVKGTFTPETGGGPAWQHPVIVDGRLYLRHGDVLSCYDVRGGG